MTKNISKIAGAIKQRFTQSSMEPIVLSMKHNNDELYVEIYDPNGGKPKTFEDISMVYVVNQNRAGMIRYFDTIEELAAFCANFPEELKAAEEDVKRLDEYYRSNVAPFPAEERSKGVDILIRKYQILSELACLDTETSYDTLETEAMERAIQESGLDAEAANRAITAAENLSFYSDWYKNVYGYRPKSR